MRIFLLTILAASVLIFSACGDSSSSQDVDDTNGNPVEIIPSETTTGSTIAPLDQIPCLGVWSQYVMSNVTVTHEFVSDGIYIVSGEDFEDIGSYSLKDDKIITNIDDEETEYTFKLEGDTLYLIDENGIEQKLIKD